MQTERFKTCSKDRKVRFKIQKRPLVRYVNKARATWSQYAMQFECTSLTLMYLVSSSCRGIRSVLKKSQDLYPSTFHGLLKNLYSINLEHSIFYYSYANMPLSRSLWNISIHNLRIFYLISINLFINQCYGTENLWIGLFKIMTVAVALFP